MPSDFNPRAFFIVYFMNNSSVRLSEIFRVFLIVFFATFFEFLFFCLILKFLRIKGCFKYDEFFLFFQSVNFIFFSFPLLYGGFSDIKLKTADFKIDWNDLCAGVKYFFCLLAMVVISFGVFYIVVNNALKIPLNEESFPANFNIFYPPGRFFIYFVSFCFIAPFAEELFFRKILYVSLRGKFSFFSSMILSAFFLQ